MIGFLIGTACLIGLAKVVRHSHGYDGRCGHGGGGWNPRGWGGERSGFGPRMFLRSLFERLDTSPGQEKVIRAAIDELKDAARSMKGEGREARSEFAKAMRGESFDEVALGGATARVEGAVDTLRKAGISAFAKVHEALDDRQREKLADLIESGPGFGRSCHGHHAYRNGYSV